MLAHQLGRRNLTPEQISYLRGKQYQAQAKDAHRPKDNGTKVGPLRTDERLAEEYKVTRQTICNDTTFATAVDTVTAAVPEAKQALLSRDTKVGKQEVRKLADIATANPQTATHVVEIPTSRVCICPHPPATLRLFPLSPR